MDTNKINFKKFKRDCKNFKKLRLVDLKTIDNFSSKKEDSAKKPKITTKEAKKCLEDIFDYMADNNLIDEKTISCFLQLNDKINNVGSTESSNKMPVKKS
jgi:hypothetical protein